MVKIKLAVPIEVDGVKVTELSMRRPKVRDRLAVEYKGAKSDFEKEILMIANLVGVPREAIEEIDCGDYMHIQSELSNFLSSSSLLT